MFLRHVFFVLVFASVACSKQQPGDDAVAEPTSQPTSEVKEEAKPEPSTQATSGGNSVDTRVDRARNRLAESDAGKLVWKSIEASGGLEPWLAHPIGFRFNYVPLKKRPPTDSYQVIDAFSSRARHVVVQGDVPYAFDANQSEFGWDGEKAWSKPGKTEALMPSNVRFWALTPYYFVGMPFVLADPGVILTLEKEETIEGTLCDVVRVTFESNIGDAPDDYYVLYFDKKTSRVRALRYVVSYKGFFPDGGHTPEKIMLFEGEISTPEGPRFAQRYPTHKWDGKMLEKVTDITLSDVAFKPDLAPDFFDVPEEAIPHEGF